MLIRTLVMGWLLLATAAIAGPPGSSGGPSSPLDMFASAPTEASAVRARLIAAQSAVEPGGTLRLGVHLNQDPGWHTYWLNGGDSGLPTDVAWTLPDGYTVSDLIWPTPFRYTEAGGLNAYGYADDVVLFADLAVPADATPGPVDIEAHVSWLMCKELCIPGDEEVALQITVGEGGVPTTGRDAELIAASLARVPRSAYDGIQPTTYLDLSAVPPGQTARAAVRVTGLADASTAEWTLFPLADDYMYPGSPTARVDGPDLLVTVPLEVDAVADPGRTIPWGGVLEIHEADGAVRYLEFEQSVIVAADGVVVESRHGDVFGSALGSTATPASGSLLRFLLMAFVGGIILNVMPCVLPVISLKILGFVQHANEDRATIFRLGLMFAAGVLVSFLALALVVIGLQAAGDQLGWGFQFQNPTFVVVMGAIVFAFGLSLFGVFEIVLPMSFGSGGGNGAYAESFFNGVLATALATPCTAPFMGPALGFAFTQPAVGVLAIFLAIGLGLALPYVLLSANPAWLRFVPKPGMWMERFKQGMGFLLMATLLWLLWVLGQQLGVDAVVWSMAFLLALGFALWLYGSLLNLNSSNGKRLAVWAVVLAIVVGSWQQFLTGPLSAEPGSVASANKEDGWVDFDPVELEAAVASGRTVFVDFTAAWCWTCKVNEKTVLAAQSVKDKFEDNGVLKMMGDWTNRDPVITETLRRYGRSGVPFYIVFPAGRVDSPIPLPEVITESIVLDALDQAGPSRVTTQAQL